MTRVVSIEDEISEAIPDGMPPRKVLSLSAPAIKALLSIQSSGMRDLKIGESVLNENNYVYFDYSYVNTTPEGLVLCVWLGTIWYDGQMYPQILLLQPSRDLGGRAAAPGCYKRVGMLYNEERLADSISTWFSDTEVQCIKIV